MNSSTVSVRCVAVESKPIAYKTKCSCYEAYFDQSVRKPTDDHVTLTQNRYFYPTRSSTFNITNFCTLAFDNSSSIPLATDKIIPCWRGIAFEAWALIERHANIKCTSPILEASNGFGWGGVNLTTNSWNGAFGLLQRGEADVLITPALLTSGRLEKKWPWTMSYPIEANDYLIAIRSGAAQLAQSQKEGVLQLLLSTISFQRFSEGTTKLGRVFHWHSWVAVTLIIGLLGAFMCGLHMRRLGPTKQRERNERCGDSSRVSHAAYVFYTSVEELFCMLFGRATGVHEERVKALLVATKRENATTKSRRRKLFSGLLDVKISFLLISLWALVCVLISNIYTANLVVMSSARQAHVPAFTNFQTLVAAGFKLAHTDREFQHQGGFGTFLNQQQSNPSLAAEASAVRRLLKTPRTFATVQQLFSALEEGREKLAVFTQLLPLLGAIRTAGSAPGGLVDLCGKLELVKIRTGLQALPSSFAVSKKTEQWLLLDRKIDRAVQRILSCGWWKEIHDNQIMEFLSEFDKTYNKTCTILLCDANSGRDRTISRRGIVSVWQKDKERVESGDQEAKTAASSRSKLELKSLADYLLIFTIGGVAAVIVLCVENLSAYLVRRPLMMSNGRQ